MARWLVDFNEKKSPVSGIYKEIKDFGVQEP